jgi:predicted ribosome quality control (RQC) complex YloA/Tae2 family protein
MLPAFPSAEYPMPVDYYLLRGLRKELEARIVPGIYRNVACTLNGTVVLTLAHRKTTCSLVFSLNSSHSGCYPVLHDTSSSHPIPPPSGFSQRVIEKHPFTGRCNRILNGYRLASIEVIPYDRILHFTFFTHSDIGLQRRYRLIFELTGRFNNCILVDGENDTIVEALKKTTSSQSTYRKILPGKHYVPPPALPGTIPLEGFQSDETFRSRLREEWAGAKRDMTVKYFLLSALKGITPFMTDEVCRSAKVEPELPREGMNEEDLHRIEESLIVIGAKLSEETYEPCIFYQIRSGTYHPLDYYLFPLCIYDTDPIEVFPSITEMLVAYFTKRVLSDELKTLHDRYFKLLNRRRKKIAAHLEDWKERLHTYENAERFRIWADNLLAGRKKRAKGMEHVTVKDIYNPGTKIRIGLDPSLSVVDNARMYYRKFKKASRGKQRCQDRVETLQKRLTVIDEFFNRADEYADPLSFADAAEKVLASIGGTAGQGFDRRVSGAVKRSRHRTSTLVSTPCYRLDSQWSIMIGKNSRHNDSLTFRVASPHDFWFHVKGCASSHVILRCSQKNMTPTRQHLIAAARITAYNSKAKKTTNVLVDYTMVKHVRRMKGAGPGKVLYTNEKTLCVDPASPSELNLAPF